MAIPKRPRIYCRWSIKSCGSWPQQNSPRSPQANRCADNACPRGLFASGKTRSTASSTFALCKLAQVASIAVLKNSNPNSGHKLWNVRLLKQCEELGFTHRSLHLLENVSLGICDDRGWSNVNFVTLQSLRRCTGFTYVY